MQKQHLRFSPSEVALIILAGGEGTRLKPLTETRCKPAVTFGGRFRIIDVALSNAINANVKDIFILTQFLASSINNYILEAYPSEFNYGTRIEIFTPEVHEHQKIWYKGTADAIRQNLSSLILHPAEYFIILSGDQLYSMDLEEMLDFAKEQDADLTIATLPVNEHEAKRMGVMKINTSYHITDFFEKPSNKETLMKFAIAPEVAKKHSALHDLSFLGSMGIYIFKRKALFDLLQEDPREDFGKHLIPTALRKGKTFAFVFSGYWEDIGTVESFYNANMSLLEEGSGLNLYDDFHPIYTLPIRLPSAKVTSTLVNNSLISEGSIIKASQIVNSLVGLKTHVEEETKILNSVVLGWTPTSYRRPIHIGKNCLLNKVIVDEGAFIDDGVKLTNMDKLSHYESDNVVIRDGVIVVKADARIPKGFSL